MSSVPTGDEVRGGDAVGQIRQGGDVAVRRGAVPDRAVKVVAPPIDGAGGCEGQVVVAPWLSRDIGVRTRRRSR